MDFNIFDAIIVVITIILGLKGLFNGFIKETAGIIGIVGGAMVASKFYEEVGKYINENIYQMHNQNAIELVGYAVTFIGIWVSIVFIGMLITALLKKSSLGLFDRVLGFVFGSAKFFIIISVIIYGLFSINLVKEKFSPYVKYSMVFPYMMDTAKFIVSIKSDNLSIKDNIDNINNKIKQQFEK